MPSLPKKMNTVRAQLGPWLAYWGRLANNLASAVIQMGGSDASKEP